MLHNLYTKPKTQHFMQNIIYQCFKLSNNAEFDYNNFLFQKLKWIMAKKKKSCSHQTNHFLHRWLADLHVMHYENAGPLLCFMSNKRPKNKAWSFNFFGKVSHIVRFSHFDCSLWSDSCLLFFYFTKPQNRGRHVPPAIIQANKRKWVVPYPVDRAVSFNCILRRGGGRAWKAPLRKQLSARDTHILQLMLMIRKICTSKK